MLAAEYNKVDMMHELIDHGADLNLQDDFGDTALMIAAREKNKEASDLLVEAGAQVDILNYENMTAADATLDVEIDEKIRSDGNHPHPERKR
jgi:ankyrin repeat protein